MHSDIRDIFEALKKQAINLEHLTQYKLKLFQIFGVVQQLLGNSTYVTEFSMLALLYW